MPIHYSIQLAECIASLFVHHKVDVKHPIRVHIAENCNTLFVVIFTKSIYFSSVHKIPHISDLKTTLKLDPSHMPAAVELRRLEVS